MRAADLLTRGHRRESTAQPPDFDEALAVGGGKELRAARVEDDGVHGAAIPRYFEGRLRTPAAALEVVDVQIAVGVANRKDEGPAIQTRGVAHQTCGSSRRHAVADLTGDQLHA